MTKICLCDLCGQRAKQVTLHAAHDIPLVIITRGIRRNSETDPDPFCFELAGEDHVPVPGVPILCERCFKGECNRVFASNRKASFGELVASLRRRN
jgi:hypothetical protein